MQLGFVSAGVLMNLAMIRAQRGRFEESRQAGCAAIELGRLQGDPRIEGGANTYLAIGACLEGRHEHAEAHARRAVELLAHVPPSLPSALAALAQALVGQGKVQDALDYGQRAYALLQEMGRVEDEEALIRVAYAECLIAIGRDQEANQVIREANSRLEERAAAIDDPAWRSAFLSCVPSHAATIALARTRRAARTDTGAQD